MPGLVVSGVLMLTFVIMIIGIFTALGPSGESADQPYNDPYPTPSAPADPTTEPPEPDPEPPETEPTESTPPKKEKPPHLRKQEGYEVIPLPDRPSSIKEAAQLIKNNTAYGQQVSSTACDGLPSDEARYPYGSVSNETWRKVAQTAANCARDMWAKPLAEAGYQATHAKVTIFSGAVDSPCGEADAPGFYCSANQAIYLNKDGGGGDHPSEYQWTWYLMTMMHEYGHHAQARTGLLTASWMWQQSQESEDSYWRVNRRMELQANCFGGMGLRRTAAVSRGNFEIYASRMFGEEVHGSTKNQYRWYTQGWSNTKVSRCNTYTAAGKDVN